MADPAPTSDLAARRLAVLAEMAEVGLRLTKAFERHVLCAEEVQVHQAKTDPDCMIMPPCDLAGVAAAFNRVSRAVRMTLALQARLEAGPWRQCGSRRNSSVPLERHGDAVVRTVVADLYGDDPKAAALAREASERLFDALDPAECLDRPFPELLAQILLDLGAAPPAADLAAAVRKAEAVLAAEGAGGERRVHAETGALRWPRAKPPD